MALQIIGGIYEFDEDNPNSLLGEGGMGKVFKGRNIHTDETVAVKELRTDIVRDNPSQVERFMREAEALRRLNHPSIVAVLDSVNTDDNHYIIMEYVRGGSLLDLLQEHPVLPIERVLEISLDLADALTRAHRLNIIHRDIKPANVLLAEDGTPRLTDFGVARIEDKTNMTRTGTVVGTLHYLSPESLNGERPNEGADIWAFGVMLYEMLAGRRPFDEESTGGLINAIIYKDPHPLSEMREGVPPGLSTLVERMLLKDPADRLDSVRKVGTELENIIRGTDSDELRIDAQVREALAAQAAAGHFDESTTDAGANPAGTPTPKLGTVVAAGRHGFTTIRDESGQEYISLPVELARRRKMMGVIGFVLALLIAIGAYVIFIEPDDTDEADTLPAGPVVAPVGENEYMVLVTRLIDVNTNEEMAGDVGTLLVAQLRQFFERDIPFSNIRIREYDGFVRNETEAREVADAVGAPIIVWGGRTEQAAALFIQVGSLEPFPYNQFERSTLERLLDVETAIIDPTERSISPYILGMLGSLHAADGNVFEFMRALAILQQEDDPPAMLVSSGVNEGLYLYFSNYLTNTEAAIEAVNDALQVDGGNALLYTMRALAHTRLGNFSDAKRDADTAVRIGPDDWTTAAILSILSADNQDEMIADTITLTEARPDDWFFYYLVGENLYNFNRLDEAREYLDRSIALGPQANYPYVASYLVAMRQGRIQDAASYVNTIVRDFPDPNFGSLVLDATFGSTLSSASVLYSSIGNLIIGQYSTVVRQTAIVDDLLTTMGELAGDALGNLMADVEDFNLISDLLMVRSVAQCATGDNEGSAATILAAIEIDPDYQLLHLLVSEAYHAMGDEASAQESLERAGGLSPEFDQLIADTISNKLTCSNFLSYFDDLNDAA